ncbi:sulfatase [Aestuariivivens sediminis]|uniref:sulfatase family protein n=1 Tax=Aestuariivivens sediminis TaxID=2913557 RepID=UPI001F5607C8|nr:sulfatase [Aestuariivivens sediminis]
MKYFQRLDSVLLRSLVLLVLLPSCRSENPALEKPNIVWITSEDNSKHYLKRFDDNGVSTPHIESLADHGIVFSRAFSNAPVCSVARSTIISGCYAPRLGAQYHRKMTKVPMPDALKMFPAYLRKAGYYTTNNSKEDYNIIKGDDVWNESSGNASWRNRVAGQPFFHVVNIDRTHEGTLHFTKEQMNDQPNINDEYGFQVQPNHPDTKLFRYTNARYRDKIQQMDTQVGAIIKELEKDGLLENTFIFYFGDHGGALPGSKGYVYETGLHIPLVVRIPEKYHHLVDIKAGSTVKGFVSFIDLGPTVLNLAGVDIPDGLDGSPFLGKQLSTEAVNARDETFAYADRFDEKYDLVRSIRKGNYKYIRSYQPFNFDGLMNNYRYKQLAYREWQSMFEDGLLNDVQSAFFKNREPEMLFDVEADPFETNNLIADPKYLDLTLALRQRLNTWVKEMPDLSFYPEYVLIENAFTNPVAFGRLHQKEIAKYVDISNLCLADFESVKEKIIQSLHAEDPWERYWGLITCSIFNKEASSLESTIRSLAYHDPVHINRVRAAEYLGITRIEDPSSVMTTALYNSKTPAEALLILNSIVLMQSNPYHYTFDIQLENISGTVLENPEVKRKLDYLDL